MTTGIEFWDSLTKYRNGVPEPLEETTAVLSYEVGRMMEQAMYAKWNPEFCQGHIGAFKSELMDAMAQITLLCQSVGVDFDEWKELGIEKAMERFTRREIKQ